MLSDLATPAPTLPRKMLLGSLGVAITLCVHAAWLTGQRAGEQTLVGDGNRPVHGELAAWRAGAEAEGKRLHALPGEGALALGGAARRLGEMQAEIIRLDEAMERVWVQTQDDEESRRAGPLWDLPPPVGGPEEEPDRDYDPATELAELVATADRLAAQLADRSRQLALFQELVKFRRLGERTRPVGWPVQSGYISSVFGQRIDPFTGRRSAHRGVDFAARPGTAVTAVASGIVIWSGHRTGFGKTVEIDHGNAYVTRYAHNAENLVRVGEVVRRGDVVSRVGSTGRATGPHLHFEVLRAGTPVSPLDYLGD